MTTAQIKTSDNENGKPNLREGTVPSTISPSYTLRKASLPLSDSGKNSKYKEKVRDDVSTNTSDDIHHTDSKTFVIQEEPLRKSSTIDGKATRKATKDDSSDNSASSRKNSEKFVKVRLGGVKDQDPLKPWEDDINYLFSQDRSKFIGEFHTEDYKIIRGYLQGSGPHLRIYSTKVEPFKKKVATLCIVHGLGGHSGRFMDLADFFAKKGYVINMIDLRGFGLSGCARANASIVELHKDIELLLRQASRNLPLFIYGHGMGAGLVASLLIKNSYLNISGVILTSGMFGLAKERKVMFLKKWYVQTFGDYLEEVDINTMMAPTALTHNNYEVKKLLDDKLSIHTVSIKLIKGLFDMMDFILPNAAKFKYPCLVVHGTWDILHSYEDSIRFYNKISSEDKELKIFQDGLHDLEHDNNSDLLKQIALSWLNQRVEATPRKLGDFPCLKLGVAKRLIPKQLRMLLSILVVVFYFFFLKRGHKLYNNKMKLFCYPAYYLYCALIKKHGWRL